MNWEIPIESDGIILFTNNKLANNYFDDGSFYNILLNLVPPEGDNFIKSEGENFTSNNMLPMKENILFLLQQRRDSYEYMDFLRGIWKNEEEVKKQLTLMSKEERDRLVDSREQFDKLWNDLWVLDNTKTHSKQYKHAKYKFNLVKDKIPFLIDQIQVLITVEPPWGFPKGRKNFYNSKLETNIECAFREFCEETMMSSESIKIWNIKPYNETFKASNNKIYCTYYYLSEVPYIIPIKKINTPLGIRKTTISDEVGDLKWMTFAEACEKLEPRKQNILKNVYHLIKTKYNVYSPFKR